MDRGSSTHCLNDDNNINKDNIFVTRWMLMSYNKNTKYPSGMAKSACLETSIIPLNLTSDPSTWEAEYLDQRWFKVTRNFQLHKTIHI